MPRKHYDYLIIGGGLASATAAKEFALMEPDAAVGILADENELPYDRPPLSKDFLLGQDQREAVFILRESFYRERGIGLHLGTAATAVRTGEHAVEAAAGGEFSYGKLLIASGCSLRRLSIPGSDLPGIYYLRTLKEAEAIKQAAAKSRQAVVIGGGFIGLEIASVLAQLNISTTIIHRADRLFEKFASEEISSFFEKYYLEQGVHMVYEDEAAELQGGGGVESVESVTTSSGRTLPCDLVCAGIGVLPDTSYLVGSGLETNNGVVVNEYLQAGPDVYAAGDIANFFDPVFQRQRRIEHWDNAIRQGRTAARNMAGRREQHCCVSYFYSTVFGLTYEFFGDMADYDEMIMRGSFERKSAAVFYLNQGVLQAAFLFNRPLAERSAVVSLITRQTQLSAVQNRLADNSFRLETAVA